jgi:transposase
LPSAQLAGVELDIRLLVDHRERLIRSRVALNNDLLWHLHDLWPELKLPASALVSKTWSSRIARRLARAEQTARVRIARDELRRPRELTAAARELEAEIAELVAQAAPQLLSEPGFGPLTAAKLLGEITGAGRFSTEARLARAAGVAPIPVSSGKTNRHRPDRGGNRQLKTAIHRIALTRARCHPETQDYLARKRAEGKTGLEAMRCLKRHLTRRIWHLLQPPTPVPETTPFAACVDERVPQPRPRAQIEQVSRVGSTIPPADRAGMRRFAGRFGDEDLEVALEATTGWRFVVEELRAIGAQVHLAEPAETAARRGTKKRAKSDRADARRRGGRALGERRTGGR